MKKYVLWLIALLLLALMVGCGRLQTDAAQQADAAQQTDAPVDDDFLISPLPQEEAAPALDLSDTSAYYARVWEEQSDALTPFVREAIAQGISADSLYDNYLFELAMPGESPFSQRSVRKITQDGILIRTAMLESEALSAADTADADLDSAVAQQYALYEDREGADAPRYQVVGLAINGSYTKCEFELTVNGKDLGTYRIDNNVLLLPLNTESVLAHEPVEVCLTVRSGNLPTPDYIFVGLHTNLSGTSEISLP